MRRLAFLMLMLGNAVAFAADSGAPDPLEAYRGQVVYLDFWASWCAPCAQSFPWLNQMHARYGDRITVVGVNVDTDDAAARRFLKQHPATFQILRDPEGRLAERFAIEGMPSSVILDGDARVLHQHSGFRQGDRARYESFIQQAVEAHGAPRR